MKAWLVPCVALSAALSCLPESDDLGAYSAEWSPAVVAGGSNASAGGAGVAGVAASPGMPGSAGAPGTAGAPGSAGVAGSRAGVADGAGVAGGADGAGSVSETAPDAVAGSGGDAVREEGGEVALPLEGAGGVSGGAGSGGGTAGVAGAPVQPIAACADGVLGPDPTSCYRVSETDADWRSARDQCVAWQGALVHVDTTEEDQFLGTLVRANQWIGASDTVLDNLFVWTDGSPVSFGNWGPLQPDRFPGADCVEKRDSTGGLWFDQPCDNARAFVCEKPVTSAP